MDNPYLPWNWWPVLDFPIDFGQYGGVQHMHIDFSFIYDAFNMFQGFWIFLLTVTAFVFVMRQAREPDTPHAGRTK